MRFTLFTNRRLDRAQVFPGPPQNGAEEQDSGGAQHAEAGPFAAHEARPDRHLAALALQGVQNRGDVARIVLPVAIHADHILIAKLEREFVAGLHASAQPQMVRQSEHPRAGFFGPRNGRVAGAIVYHQDRHAGQHGLDLGDYATDRAGLAIGGDEDQQAACPTSQSRYLAHGSRW